MTLYRISYQKLTTDFPIQTDLLYQKLTTYKLFQKLIYHIIIGNGK